MIQGNTYKPLTPLQSITQSASGGLCHIDIVPVDWVIYFPEIDPLYETVTQKIRLQEGRAWMRLPVPDRARGFDENQKPSDAGPYVETTVSCFVPFATAGNEVLLQKMRYYRYIVVVALSNGIKRVCGTLDNPLLYSRSFGSGSSAESDMGSTVTFSWVSENSAAVYLGIPSDNEVVEASPHFILGTGTGAGLGDGSGGAIGTTINYP